MGINKNNLDTAIAPGDNFYLYANGGWLKRHPIPDEFSRYGTFDLLREDNKKQVKEIIEEVAASAGNTSDPIADLVGSFYSSGMDAETIEKLGYSPIQEELEKISGISTREDVNQLISEFFAESHPLLFHIFPSPDRENSDMIITNLYQGGMGLTDVDYYRSEDERSKEIRKKYLQYVSDMLQFTTMSNIDADAAAQVIMKLETRLAHAAMTRLELRDPYKTSNKMNLSGLVELAPAVNWPIILTGLGLKDTKDFNVNQPDFFVELSRMLEDVSVADWKIYFRWRLINSAASLLSSRFENRKFEFYGKYLSGKKEMQPRWKRVTGSTEDALGEALGRLYVAKHFPEKAKQRMLRLVENLRKILKQKIETLGWMSEPTKAEALMKLERMQVKIGYPDKWRDFSNLNFANKSYYDNYRSASVFNMKYELAKIDKPADRQEWGMTPQTVNAYYHPLLNEIVFPAGILQAPFFDMEADDAVNYGAIGVVIGHEMTHGFDDQGRKFDKHGNLNDWWTEEDAKQFADRSQILVDQFAKIKIHENVYADGKLTLGENIADLGGINIAFDAVKLAWAEDQPKAEIDGFSPMQRFFLAYAHIWANNIRDKEKLRLTKEDVHSLGENRVNGPLPNVEAFYEAFGLGNSDKVYLPEDQRADIW